MSPLAADYDLLQARIADLERELHDARAALRDIIVADCCGCSVYGEIAAKALGLTDDERLAMVKAHEAAMAAERRAEDEEWLASLPPEQAREYAERLGIKR